MSDLVVRVNQHEEAGRELGEEEEIEEEPSLGRGGGGREEPEEMLAVTLLLPHRVEHLTVPPLTPTPVLTAQRNNYSIDSPRLWAQGITIKA